MFALNYCPYGFFLFFSPKDCLLDLLNQKKRRKIEKLESSVWHMSYGCFLHNTLYGCIGGDFWFYFLSEEGSFDAVTLVFISVILNYIEFCFFLY